MASEIGTGQRAMDIFRAILVGCCFLGLLAFSARLISEPLSDKMEPRPTVLAFGGGSDRSVFAPAAYGEDSQTAVDDDEDMMQSIRNIENKGKSQGPAQAHAPKVLPRSSRMHKRMLIDFSC
jgi:hypothetical protein